MDNIRIECGSFFCQNMDCKLHIPCHENQKGISIPTSNGSIEYERIKMRSAFYDGYFYICDKCAKELSADHYMEVKDNRANSGLPWYIPSYNTDWHLQFTYEEDEMDGYSLYLWYAIDSSEEKKRPKVVKSGTVVAKDAADAQRMIGRETDEDHEIIVRLIESI